MYSERCAYVTGHENLECPVLTKASWSFSRTPARIPSLISLTLIPFHSKIFYDFILVIISTPQFCFSTYNPCKLNFLLSWNIASWDAVCSCSLLSLLGPFPLFSSSSPISTSSNSPCSSGTSADAILSNSLAQMLLCRCNTFPLWTRMMLALSLVNNSCVFWAPSFNSNPMPLILHPCWLFLKGSVSGSWEPTPLMKILYWTVLKSGRKPSCYPQVNYALSSLCGLGIVLGLVWVSLGCSNKLS